MQGIREKIAGVVRRARDAIGGPLSRVRVRLARMPAGRRAVVVFGAGAIVVALVLIVAGLAVLAPGDQAAGPRGSVAVGVPLPPPGPR